MGAARPYPQIGELAQRYRLTLRTLRFYEQEGLLRPQRRGTRRFYPPLEEARLRLILRGKALGLPLDVIGGGLMDAGPHEARLRIPKAVLEAHRKRLAEQAEALADQQESLEGVLAGADRDPSEITEYVP